MPKRKTEVDETQRSCGQVVFICIFLVLHLLVSFYFVDLYPFTSMPMFSDNKTELYEFKVSTSEGIQLSPELIALGSRDVINPKPRLGLALPPSLQDDIRTFLTDDSVEKEKYIRKFVLKSIATKSNLDRLIVQNKGCPRQLKIFLERISYDWDLKKVTREVVDQWRVEVPNCI